MANSWENAWTADNTTNPETALLTQEERDLACKLIGHMRHLASYKEPGDGTSLVTRDAQGDLPTDHRNIDPGHSTSYFTVEHRGTYWEVGWGSVEFSSSFHAVGRGLTLAEALADCEAHQ